MTDRTGHEELLIRYLLGELPEREQTRLEERFFTDDEYYEQLLALEDELRYDYAQGKLSPGRRERFEKRFLASPEERARAELAGALLHKLSETAGERQPASSPTPPERVAWWSALLVLLRMPGPALRFSLAAALVMVTGSMWLFFSVIQLRTQLKQLQAQQGAQEQQWRGQAADARTRTEQLQGALGQERRQRAQLEQELAKAASSAQNPKKPSPSLPAIVSLILTPGRVRTDGGESKRLLVPRDADRLQLQLDLKNKAEYKSYRAALLTADGHELWSQDMLRARPTDTGQAVVLQLPARFLSEDDYEITLRGVSADRALEEAGTYYFRVVRK